MTAAKKTFEIRDARANGTKANALVFVDPSQPPIAVGTEFRLRGVDISPEHAAGLWKVVAVYKVPGTGLWSVDFEAA